ncbi:hypothetical protein Purlil1_11129 [Purpureocillium lilacinum]|uniref:Uncharacterized protein n=1 Tax=Purpureocillium lilacinum TaxID=33203 RepID=A0ABR0BLN1_PURLI|nr:hypothetical protein Purlil1_11129 [Purpureocillium lilacinum]
MEGRKWPAMRIASILELQDRRWQRRSKQKSRECAAEEQSLCGQPKCARWLAKHGLGAPDFPTHGVDSHVRSTYEKAVSRAQDTWPAFQTTVPESDESTVAPARSAPGLFCSRWAAACGAGAAEVAALAEATATEDVDVGPRSLPVPVWCPKDAKGTRAWMDLRSLNCAYATQRMCAMSREPMSKACGAEALLQKGWTPAAVDPGVIMATLAQAAAPVRISEPSARVSNGGGRVSKHDGAGAAETASTLGWGLASQLICHESHGRS